MSRARSSFRRDFDWVPGAGQQESAPGPGFGRPRLRYESSTYRLKTPDAPESSYTRAVESRVDMFGPRRAFCPHSNMLGLTRFSGRARCGALGLTLLACAATCVGQSSGDSGSFCLYERFDTTVNTLGLITRSDPTAGYKLNQYLAFDAGLPVYIVRPHESLLSGLATNIASSLYAAKVLACSRRAASRIH